MNIINKKDLFTMPHFRFRAVAPEIVESLSKTLIDELESVMKSPRIDFTFELIKTDFFHEGKADVGYPFVEVLWFDRGQETKDVVAKCITDHLSGLLSTTQNIAVIFTALEPTNYYDNGQHY
jgi:phenylpyruvate tautomerase PptA (4-oxalocrotonate tautomerase family)